MTITVRITRGDIEKVLEEKVKSLGLKNFKQTGGSCSFTTTENGWSEFTAIDATFDINDEMLER